MYYALPLTDPRYLDADEETVLRDLLLIRVHQREAHPGHAQAERLAAQPGIGAHMEARKKAAMAAPGMISALQALGVKIGVAPTTTHAPKTISFKRKGGKAPVKP